MNVRRSIMLAGFCLAALAVAQVASSHSLPGQILYTSAPLDDPGGVAVSSGDYDVYVASAGATPNQCQENAPCTGSTGYVTKFVENALGPRKRRSGIRLASGFAFQSDGGTTTGIRGVAVTPDDRVVVAAQNGNVLRIEQSGGTRTFVGSLPGTPSAVAAVPAGYAVTDAESGKLILISPSGGDTRPLATFPARNGARSTPTSVVYRDGVYYVGDSGDGTHGRALIWRVAPGQTPTVWKTGLTAIVGLDFGPDGRLYVAEAARAGIEAARNAGTKGVLLRIEADGSTTEIAAGELKPLGGLAVGSDNIVYVTQRDPETQRGSLVAIDPYA